MRTVHTLSLTDFLSFFTKKLRLSNPWNYKIPFLISIPYFVFLMRSRPFEQPIYSIMVSVCVIIGVAGIGYLTNDLGDRQKDALISKQNATSRLSVYNITLLFTLFLAFALCPWLYLPFTLCSLLLLFFQLFLFCIYAFRPFRLKEKGLWGVLTDSFYAHVNPAILASYTFYMFGYVFLENFTCFLISLCLWQFILGIRNIIFHQVKDYADDISSGTKTFVTVSGKAKAINLCVRYLLPLEIVTFFIFSVFISTFSYLFISMVLIYWIIVYIKTKHKLHAMDYRDRAYVFLDDLYIKWVPLFILTILSIKDTSFLPVLIMHFLIFRSGIKSFLSNNLNVLKNG